MGVILYRPGKSHVVNGIQCKAQVFDEYSYLSNLDAGWFLDPKDFHSEEDQKAFKAEEAEKKRIFEEKEAEEKARLEEQAIAIRAEKLLEKISKDNATDQEVREYAKNTKIKNWHNKGIDTLKSEIIGE